MTPFIVLICNKERDFMRYFHHRMCSVKKFWKFHSKTLMFESLFNFIRKRLQHRCFSVNIAKFLRTPEEYSEEYLRETASVYLKSKLQLIVIYTLAENFIFNFRIYKIFCYLLSFENFSSTKFLSAFGSFSVTKDF